jgi:hypothetical protein
LGLHLVCRKEVDWQLWVSDGEKPLPLEYVITSKWVAAPQEYSIEFGNWNTVPSLDGASFSVACRVRAGDGLRHACLAMRRDNYQPSGASYVVVYVD